VNWLKSLLLMGVIAVILYGVYAWLMNDPTPRHAEQGPPPPWTQAPQASQPPVVQLPDSAPHTLAPSPAVEQPGASIATGEGDPTADAARSAAAAELQPPATGDSSAARAVQEGIALARDSQSSAPQRHDARGPGNRADSSSLPGAVSDNIHARFASDIQGVLDLLRQDRLADAHLVLSRWYPDRHRLNPDEQRELLRFLDGLAGSVVYSQRHLLLGPYTVKAGETLQQIADRHKIPWKLLAKINGLAGPEALAPGTTLKVVPGPFHAEVDLAAYELTLFLADGRYAGRFSIGVGRELLPEDGQYIVTRKELNPPYQDIPGGDPRNPLGDRMIYLDDRYCLHGTNAPETVGEPCKEGCIRLTPRDVEDVYDILSEGSRVVIRR
jgi:hypothetical protein